jgi:glycosyltransferase involved in cell wall biosynthesis
MAENPALMTRGRASINTSTQGNVAVLHVLGLLNQNTGGPLRGVLDMSAKAGQYGLKTEILGQGPINIHDNPFPPGAFHCLPGWPAGGFSFSTAIWGWCRSNLHRFDGVVLHGMWTYNNWAMSRSCLRSGTPYAVFAHGMLDRWPILGQGRLKRWKKIAYWHWRERRVVSGARAAFFTTQRELDHSRSTLRLPDIPCHLSPFCPGIRVEHVEQPERADLIQQSGTRCVLFLGRLHPKKGLDLLLRAWTRAKMPTTWKIVIAGPGDADYVSKLKRLAADLGILDAVRFTGPVAGADKQYLLGVASWFVLPSSQENLGVAPIEAILMGCPVALSTEVYLADLLHPDTVVLPLDPGAWAAFFSGPMQDDALRRRILDLDHKLSAPRFQIENAAQEWAELLGRTFPVRVKPYADAPERPSGVLS